MLGSYFADVCFPLVFEPQFQVSLVTGHGDGRQPFRAVVLQESGDGFVGIQALRSSVHEKSSFWEAPRTKNRRACLFSIARRS